MLSLVLVVLADPESGENERQERSPKGRDSIGHIVVLIGAFVLGPDDCLESAYVGRGAETGSAESEVSD